MTAVVRSSTASRWLVPLGLFAAAVSLGAGHVCARVAFRHGVGILTAATLRAGAAVVILFVLLAARRIPFRGPPRELRGTIVLGLCVVVQTLLIQFAVKRLPVTLAILVFYTYPLLTAAATSLLGDHRLTPGRVITLLLAFGGLTLVLGVEAATIDLVGLAAAFGASIAFTSALILTPRLAPSLAAPLRTFLMLATAASVFAIATVAADAFALPEAPEALAGLAGLVLFYACGFVALFLLLPRLGAVQSALILNLEPVAVAVIAWLTIGETLSLLQCAGAGIVVATVLADRLRTPAS